MSVIVFGSINLDHIAYVDRHPQLGETCFGTYRQSPGGKGANQAIAAARAGADVAIAGAIGGDAAGDKMLEVLQQDGIDASRVVRVGAPTGVALIVVDAQSHNSIVVCAGANQQAKAPAIELADSSDSRVFLAQGEVPVNEVAAFFADARSVGGRTIFNPAPFRPISDALLETIDVLVMNEVEFAQFNGLDQAPSGIDEVQNLLGECQTLPMLVVTLGEQGVLARFEGTIIRIAAPKVVAVDTVGAGDCFCGYLAALLSRGSALPRALSLATHAASISVTRHGAATSMPRHHELPELPY